MKTENEIKKRIEHIKTLGNGYGINERRIKELQWVLKDKESAMCEADSNAVLGEVRAVYDDLLEEAMYLYQYYPNNFRKTAEEYFKKEIEMQKSLSPLISYNSDHPQLKQENKLCQK